MLDKEIKDQLQSVFSLLEGNYVLVAKVAAGHPSKKEFIDLIEAVANCSSHLNYREEEGDSPSLTILDDKGNFAPFEFRAIPTGHEFSSLILAILNFAGKGKNIPDDFIQQRIKELKGEHLLKTYISLTCTICPGVVQALNLIAIINPRVQHEIIDGGINVQEVETLGIQGVPSVYCENKLLHVGKANLATLLEKLEEDWGTDITNATQEIKKYDVIVVGGGPAGSAAAIYSARKGLRVEIIAERLGGQIKETVGIENLISTPYTTGKELAANLRVHIQQYNIDIFENRKVTQLIETSNGPHLLLNSKEEFTAPAVIIATGAGWRQLNVPGEKEYIGRGVAFCPHCDGPFYKDKEVAVIGGGNSGIEAALDLSGICSKVTVIEFMENLKADKVLQKQAEKKENINIIPYTQVVEVIGNGEKVTAIKVKNRKDEQEQTILLDAIFVQIGLTANSLPFKGIVEMSPIGEIKIDEKCRTSTKGIYATGDVSTVPYKQIIIAMGEGAKAALSAFEDRLTGQI